MKLKDTIIQNLKKEYYNQKANKLIIEEYTLENELAILGSLLLSNLEGLPIQKLKANQITQKNFVDVTNKIVFSEIHRFYITQKNQSRIDTMLLSKELALKYPEVFRDYETANNYLLISFSKTTMVDLDTLVQESKENYSKHLLQNLKDIDFAKMDTVESKTYLKNIMEEMDNQSVTDKPLNGQSGMDYYLAELLERSNQENIELPFLAFQKAGIVFGSSNLVTIAGSPKSGKTSWGMQTALEFAKNKKNVLFFTLELSFSEMVEKCLAYLSCLNPTVIKNIQTDANSQKYGERWNESCKYLFEDLKDNISFVGDKKCSIWEVCQIIRDSNKIKKLDFVYLDQLSFIHTNNQFGTEKHKEYDFIVRELKELCKELKICIVLLAQLNRSVSSNEDIDYADIHHIKDSSAIAETSDILILAKRNEKQAKAGNDIIEVKFTIVSRHTKGGLVDLNWNTKLARFEN